MKKIYGVVGAGGHGREVMPLARVVLGSEIAAGETELVFAVEGEPNDDVVNGTTVLSLSRFLEIDGERRFNIAIADSRARARISDLCIEAGASPFDIVAANSIVMPDTEIGEGVMVSPFVLINANVKIGRFFHANAYSRVAHDCVIGDFVTFAPSVSCNGNVSIGDHAYIGAGAIIKPGKAGTPLVIGEGAIVGMGAVVTKDVAPYSTVIGNPARPIQK